MKKFLLLFSLIFGCASNLEYEIVTDPINFEIQATGFVEPGFTLYGETCIELPKGEVEYVNLEFELKNPCERTTLKFTVWVCLEGKAEPDSPVIYFDPPPWLNDPSKSIKLVDGLVLSPGESIVLERNSIDYPLMISFFSQSECWLVAKNQIKEFAILPEPNPRLLINNLIATLKIKKELSPFSPFLNLLF